MSVLTVYEDLNETICVETVNDLSGPKMADGGKSISSGTMSVLTVNEDLNETISVETVNELSKPEMADDVKSISSDEIQSKVVVQVLPSLSIPELTVSSSYKSQKSFDLRKNLLKQSTLSVLSEESELDESSSSESDNDLSSASDSYCGTVNPLVYSENYAYDSKLENSHEKSSQSILLLNTNNFKKNFRLPSEAIHIFKTWVMQHKSDPYPSEDDKKELADLTNLSLRQVNSWFFKVRRRLRTIFDEYNSLMNHKTRIELDATTALKVEKQNHCKSFVDKSQIPHGRQLSYSDHLASLNHNRECHQKETSSLGIINHIVFALETASCQVLRILHYILFGMYGKIGNECRVQKTRESILQFDGFVFDDNEVYFKKVNALMQLPSPLFLNIYKILMNDLPTTRKESVDILIRFLSKPSDKFSIEKTKEKIKEEEKNDYLKKQALEARPIILLEKLSESILEEVMYKNKVEDLNLFNENVTSEKYIKPSFIQNGGGVTLKKFPEMVINIKKARRRIINLLHMLLYGRPGSDEINRQNILEFSGFETFPESFIGRKTTYLKRLKSKELMQLCDIFSLRARSGNKTKKIKKLLYFLQSPGSDLNKKGNVKQNSRHCVKHIETTPKEFIDDTSKMEDNAILRIKLQDFQSICSNVECATPENLTELNDLLYVKPCDSSDIHQKILDFTSFTFNANSFDFHYRKTLLHYMDFKVVKKIAALLDIKDWEDYNNQEDLAMNIMNFLMDMKLPVKKRKCESGLKTQRMKPLIHKLHSSEKDSLRSSSSENIDSTYASEEMKFSSEENDWRDEATNYRPRPKKSGLTSKHEQILNDSTPLLEFIQHPTEKELHYLIAKILTSSPLTISMGDLVREVLNCFPTFNLHYRIDFIKTKTLEVLQELRMSAISPDDF